MTQLDPQFLSHDGQLMVTAAHRYCLGRTSTIPGTCIDWLKTHWSDFNALTRGTILRDTKRALERNEAGMACDVEMWQAFIQWAKEQG